MTTFNWSNALFTLACIGMFFCPIVSIVAFDWGDFAPGWLFAILAVVCIGYFGGVV